MSGEERVKIPIRLANAMDVNGVSTLEELGALGTATIAHWRNCGIVTVRLIQKLLKDNGIPDAHPWVDARSGTTIPVKSPKQKGT